MTQKTNAAAPVSIELETPIKREGDDITTLTLRKPNSGELRGVSLTDLLNMDVAALTKVIPRITAPTITEADVRQMDVADLVSVGGEVAGFLLPKRMKQTD